METMCEQSPRGLHEGLGNVPAAELAEVPLLRGARGPIVAGGALPGSEPKPLQVQPPPASRRRGRASSSRRPLSIPACIRSEARLGRRSLGWPLVQTSIALILYMGNLL